MIVLKYIITFVLSIISASFLGIILTVLRCGIPLCIEYKKEPDISNIDKQAINNLQKKYYLSSFLDLLIIAILSIIVYFLMKECFIFYLIMSLFYLLISIRKTGITEDNIAEFTNSIKANKSIIVEKTNETR